VFNRCAESGASISGTINITAIALKSVIRSHDESGSGLFEPKAGFTVLLTSLCG